MNLLYYCAIEETIWFVMAFVEQPRHPPSWPHPRQPHRSATRRSGIHLPSSPAHSFMYWVRREGLGGGWRYSHSLALWSSGTSHRSKGKTAFVSLLCCVIMFTIYIFITNSMLFCFLFFNFFFLFGFVFLNFYLPLTF